MENKNEKRKKMMEMKFPKFNPNLATLDIDPPNIFNPPSKRKKPSDLLIHLLLIPNLLILNCCNNFMNKIRNLFDVV